MRNWRQHLKDVALICWVCAAAIAFTVGILWMVDYDPPPKKPVEVHQEAIDQFHRSMHKGGMLHPWFHPMLKMERKKVGSRMKHLG